MLFFCHSLLQLHKTDGILPMKNEKIMIAVLMNSHNETKFLLGQDILFGLLAASNANL